MGVLYWSVPVDAEGKWKQEIEKVAHEREYKNSDIVASSRETMGEKFEGAMAMVWKEYVLMYSEYYVEIGLTYLQTHAR